MNYFTIFASKNNIDDIEVKISDVFEKGFAIVKNDNEYVIKSKALFKKYKLIIRIMSEDMNPDYFANNIPGMMGYYDNIPFEDGHLKELVLTQISVLNTVIAIESEKEIHEEQMQLFTNLLSSIGGIGFLPNGTLLDDEGIVIVYPDGQSGPSDFRPHACTRKVRGQEVSSEEGEQRKNKTIAYLKEKAIPYTASLPQLPTIEACQFKTQEDIARRAVALLIVIQFARDVAQGGNVDESRDFFINMLRTYKVENYLTSKEREFLQASKPDVQEALLFHGNTRLIGHLFGHLDLLRSSNFLTKYVIASMPFKLFLTVKRLNNFIFKLSCVVRKRYWMKQIKFTDTIGLV